MHTIDGIRGRAGANLTLWTFASALAFTATACDTDEGRPESPQALPGIDLPDIDDDSAANDLAPLLEIEGPDVIEGRYIVVMKKDTAAQAVHDLLGATALKAGEDEIDQVYTSAIVGFAGRLSAETLDDLRHDPDVAYVEPDRRFAPNDVTWGIDRIDQDDLPFDDVYDPPATGDGVHAYIVDTGIRGSHQEFAGRMGEGWTAINDGYGWGDCQGHGTHVAGTVGGTTYGVAPDVILHSARVFGCSGGGYTSWIIGAIDWIKANAEYPAVANFSLGGGASQSLDNAVEGLVQAGVVVAVAAGNSTADACWTSPARVADALTVGSTDWTDKRSDFSNFGSCVDILAPGSSITSAWKNSDTSTAAISGTSMASPHVAGAAAVYLELNPNATTDEAFEAILDTSVSGRLSDLKQGTPNRLLSVNFTVDDNPNPDPDPDPEPEPDPDPEPEPNPVCPDCDLYSGSLPGTGWDEWQPDGQYYYADAGTHIGVLEGPQGTDFDLYLYRWNGWGQYWQRVGVSQSPTSIEEIQYPGSAGYYVWRVYAYSGGGSYELQLGIP